MTANLHCMGQAAAKMRPKQVQPTNPLLADVLFSPDDLILIPEINKSLTQQQQNKQTCVEKYVF